MDNFDDKPLEWWRARAYEGRGLLVKSAECLLQARTMIIALERSRSFWRVGCIIAWIVTGCILMGIFT